MLTDVQCRKAAPRDAAYKLPDGRGLFLYVTPSGYKSWRLKYRIAGKERLHVIGSYPEITLTRAREQRDALRRQIAEGVDPSVAKKQQQAAARTEAASTFEKIARQWHAVQKPRWSTKHAEQVMSSLELYLFPKLGKLPINAITPPMMLEAIGHVGLEVLRELYRLVDYRTGRLEPSIDYMMRRLRRSRDAVARGVDFGIDLLRVDEEPAQQ